MHNPNEARPGQEFALSGSDAPPPQVPNRDDDDDDPDAPKPLRDPPMPIPVPAPPEPPPMHVQVSASRVKWGVQATIGANP